MAEQVSVIVTSVGAPNDALRSLASGCRRAGARFLVVGDTKSPPDFSLDGCEFWDVDRQRGSGLAFAVACPTRHYARKNIGYLLAIRDGCRHIIETDDDNLPRASFFEPRERRVRAARVAGTGWTNIYRYFSSSGMWPRGLPLDAVSAPLPGRDALPRQEADCPIQQDLVDENPDVDAAYRLLFPLPQSFDPADPVATGQGAWCPFNSQNTRWWADAFPLLYLPAFCSFRMTDIWRSFVAQRVAWENGWSILFRAPSAWQERNEHDLMRDFEAEVPGYLNNRRIGEALDALALRPGTERIPDNMRTCYEALVRLELVGGEELALLDAWLADLRDAMPGA
jgi:hypothetical protein